MYFFCNTRVSMNAFEKIPASTMLASSRLPSTKTLNGSLFLFRNLFSKINSSFLFYFQGVHTNRIESLRRNFGEQISRCDCRTLRSQVKSKFVTE